MALGVICLNCRLLPVNFGSNSSWTVFFSFCFLSPDCRLLGAGVFRESKESADECSRFIGSPRPSIELVAFSGH